MKNRKLRFLLQLSLLIHLVIRLSLACFGGSGLDSVNRFYDTADTQASHFDTDESVRQTFHPVNLNSGRPSEFNRDKGKPLFQRAGARVQPEQEINYRSMIGGKVNRDDFLGGTARMDANGVLPKVRYKRSPIRISADLNCNSFFGEGNCQWGNEPNKGDEALDWVRGAGQWDPDRAELMFGTRETAAKYWLMASSDHLLSKTQHGTLVSDPIRCQIDDGILMFKYWNSANGKVRVCLREVFALEKFYKFCTLDISGGDPGPAIVTIPKGLFAAENLFEIVIIAHGFDAQLFGQIGGVVIIDEIRYMATICNYGVSCGQCKRQDDAANDVGNLIPHPLNHNLMPQPKEIEIDSRSITDPKIGIHAYKKEYQKYIASPGEDFRRSPIFSATLAPQRLVQITTTTQISPYIFTTFSPPHKPETEKELPFNITLENTEDVESCKKISCSFELGSCSSTISLSSWASQFGTVGNRHTGIRQQYLGNFAVVKGPSQKATITFNGPLNFSTAHTIYFCYYRAIAGSNLMIQTVGPGLMSRQVIFVSPKIDKKPHRWICESAKLPMGNYDSLEISATNLHNQFSYFALDEIHLLRGATPLC